MQCPPQKLHRQRSWLQASGHCSPSSCRCCSNTHTLCHITCRHHESIVKTLSALHVVKTSLGGGMEGTRLFVLLAPLLTYLQKTLSHTVSYLRGSCGEKTSDTSERAVLTPPGHTAVTRRGRSAASASLRRVSEKPEQYLLVRMITRERRERMYPLEKTWCSCTRLAKARRSDLPLRIY